jgi:N-acetyl-anhydromuramyl-L-alanine amidase AmpD
MSNNTSIVVCGQKFDIGTRVVLWDEPGGLNGYDTSANSHWEEDRKTGKNKKVVVKGVRYSKRSWRYKNPNLEQLKKIVTQFFLHHSGLYHSRTTYNVLHKQRRLSVHFILDDDGTLYQTLDLKEKAWHGGSNNPMSVGIEIDSRASVRRFPDAYDKAHQKKYKVGPRKVKRENVQGMWVDGFEYSQGQYETLIRLGMALCEIFPAIGENPDFPRTSSGKLIKSVLKKPKAHKGFMCHYHTNNHKWDPVSLDHQRFLNGIKRKNPQELTTFFGWDTWKDKQEALQKLGYDPGPIDGVLGAKTKRAIREFQSDHGLIVDGIWGKKTTAMMVAAFDEKGIR